MSDVVVTISIVVNTQANQKTFSISVDQEPVPCSALQPGDEIRWEIDANSADWTFTKDHHGTSNGVTIKNAGNKYHDKAGAHGQKHHKWERKIKDNQKYRYTISVTNETVASPTNPVTTLTWDPSIMND
jgi:hypothetical protein